MAIPLIEFYAPLVLALQIVHSLEELSTGFHKRWYLFTMPFWWFLSFELIFSIFWGLVIFSPAFPYRVSLVEFFLLLMFANGIQHIVWWGVTKKYVPGLITGVIHVLVFVSFFYQILG